MFVGHGLLALAVAAALATRLGRTRRSALALGVFAAAFATLPDVDVLYPLLASLGRSGTITGTPEAFWHLSTVIHRGVTHSLVIGLWTAAGVTLWASRDESVDPRSLSGLGFGVRFAALTVLAAMVVTVVLAGGVLAAATVAVMAVAALGLAVLARRYGVGPRALGAVAIFGLLSHPFGDLVTGQPPPLLFPLDAQLFESRIALHADPTLHLVGAFGLELAVVWLAVLVLATLFGRRPLDHVRPQALVGVVFALAVLVIPPPRLDAATGFVAGALAVGVVGVPLRWRPSREHYWDGLCTALAAVTLAVASYGVAYGVVLA